MPRENFEGGALPITQWTLVDQAGRGRPEAIGEFLKLYQRAMVTHLVIRQRWKPHDAEDLVQSFIVDKIMTRNVIAAADRNRGKRFRNYLLTVLDRYGLEHRRAASRQKRRPDAAVALDEKFDAPASDSQADGFDVQWARDLLVHCVNEMEQACLASGRKQMFEAFRARVLQPAFEGTEPISYADMVEKFGFTDPLQASNTLITAKRMFERHLRAGIQAYAQSETDVDEEIQELFNVLSNA